MSRYIEAQLFFLIKLGYRLHFPLPLGMHQAVACFLFQLKRFLYDASLRKNYSFFYIFLIYTMMTRVLLSLFQELSKQLLFISKWQSVYTKKYPRILINSCLMVQKFFLPLSQEKSILLVIFILLKKTLN